MIIAPLPDNETDRLAELESYRLIGLTGQPDVDFLTDMAAEICGTPTALVSLIFADHQWFLSNHGGTDTEAPRDTAFCTHAILEPERILEIPDARKDPRFHDNPVVLADPPVVFYAGVPLVNERGFALGTLCVVDHKPGALNEDQRDKLRNLARQTLRILELRRLNAKNTRLNEEMRRVIAIHEQTQSINRIGTWTLDIESHVVEWSPELYRIHDIPPGTHMDRDSGLDFYHPDDRPQFAQALERATTQGIPMDLTGRLITPNGAERWVRATGCRLGNQIIGAFQDVTAMKQQELKFRGIFDSTVTFIGFMSRDGTVLDANETALSFADLRREDVIGKPFWECYWWQISPVTQAKLRSHIRRAAAGESLSYEVEVWGANQTPTPILFSLKPVRDEHGRVTYIIPEGRPIRDIVDSRDRYRSVIEGTNVGTWEWNVQTGATTFNERWAQIIGYTLEELAPISIDTWTRHAHPDDLEESGRRLERCFEGKDEFYDIECRMRHRDGHWVWVLDRGKVFRWTEDGKPLLMFGTHQDITQRKRDEEALRISEQSFRSSFDSAANGMALVGPNGEWQRVNEQLCRIVGYSHEELAQLTFQDITHPDDLDADLALLDEVISGKRSTYQIEKRYFHKDGQVVYILLSVSAVRDNGGHILYFISQITDISALKQAESKLQSLLAVTSEQNSRLRQFAHIVSHNLRSHSNGIHGLLQAMTAQMPKLSEEEVVQLLLRSSEHLRQTIVDLTEVVNAELGHHPRSRISLAEVVNKNVDSLTSQMRQAGVSVQISVSPAHQVWGIAAFVDSIVLNLLTNAIKYCDPNKESYVHITAETGVSNTCRLMVSDNGLGIDLSRHGERMFSLYATFHRHEDARGVGLFISKSQAESMNGTLEVSSEAGLGSRFTLTLPSADTESPQAKGRSGQS